MKISCMKLNFGKTIHQNLSRKKSAWTPVFALAASLLLLAGAISVQAATTFTTTTTASGNWGTATNWAGGVAPTGSQAGNIAANGAATIALTLNTATTIGQIQDTHGSAQNFTINASGTVAMTMDNTGGVNNPLGNADAFIGETSSGGINLLPNIVIQNTDLDLGNTGSTTPTLTIGTLGTSTITATTARNLKIFQNQATSTKSININSSIGSSGSVITVQNVGTGGGVSTMNLNGVVGPNAAVIQNSAHSSLSLNAANTYTGATTISAGALLLGASGNLAAGSSVSIAAGATFDVSTHTTYTLGTSATLSASGNASAATIKGGTTVSLGSRPVNLTYNGANPALTLSAGTLQLNNNTFTVVVPGSALAAGTYTLVSTPGAISGTPNSTPSFTGGNGIVSGATATVSTSGNNVVLTVTSGGGPGPVSASHSTVSPATASIAADGTSTQVITVQARDTNNVNETTGGATVVFSRTGTGTLSGTTDNGNGTYKATLTAPSSAGSATVTATLGGTAVGTAVGASSCVVTFTPSGGPITIQAETGVLSGTTPPTVDTNQAGFHGTGFVNMQTTTSTVTLNNVSGNGGGAKILGIRYALGVAASRTVNLIVNGATQAITFVTTTTWTNWQTLNVNITLNNSTANTIAFTTTGQDSGNIDEITIPATSGGPGPVSASHSTVSPATASIPANGTSTQVITVQARDTNNVNETTGGAAVVFSRTGTGTLSGTTDNGNGTYTATLTSPTSAGSATVTATLGGTAVGTAVGASSSVVTFTTSGGTVSAPNSTVSPALASLTANGGSTQVITVQARDASNNNITTGGATVVFSRSGTGTISGTTDNGNGTYTATLTAPTSVGSGTITATLNGTSVGTAVGASQCAATYFSTNFGDAIVGLTAAQTTNFTVGDTAFAKVETVASGLGPIFNNSGCANCHNFPVDAGSGTATVTRFGLNTNGVFNPLTSLGGSLLQDNSTTTNFEVVPASANVNIKRQTTPVFGSGLIEAIPDSVIQSNAALANADGIVGTVALVTDPVDGRQHVGRFGWKAQLATLLAFAADAANNEMGITSRILPVGQAPNGNTNLYNQLNTVADPNDKVDASGKADIDRMSDYMRLLSPPPTLPLTANAVAGKALFSQLRCDICHTPVLTTGPNFIPVSDLAIETNSAIAALSSKAVPLYSDLLLHNMGSLADGIAQAAASTNQMRTAPLWGLSQSLPYLHDGRANTVDAAIRAHAGDALPAATRYINLSTNQQQQVVQFLNSL